jgi:Tfp pilus assembly protein PilZ
MKCFLLADNRPELLATLEPILKHWGYRILSASNVSQVNDFLRQSEPCLLIFGMQLLGNPDLLITGRVFEQISRSDLPLLALEQEAAANLLAKPLETLAVPVDIFTLFSFIQRFVEKHPRQNLRLKILIPGMYKTDGTDYTLADVYSLSMQGLFFKAAARLQAGERLTVVIPLLGHCKELEVGATVLYTVQPDNDNNYLQGFGVCFDPLPVKDQASLQRFIEERFLNEVSNCRAGVGDFCKKQLKT